MQSDGWSCLFHLAFFMLFDTFELKRRVQPRSNSMLHRVLHLIIPSCLKSHNKPQSSSTIIEGRGLVLALASLQGAMEDVHLGSIPPHPLVPFNTQWAMATKKHEPTAPGLLKLRHLFKWRTECKLKLKTFWKNLRCTLKLDSPLHHWKKYNGLYSMFLWGFYKGL